MSDRKYICQICFYEADSLDEIEEHLEHAHTEAQLEQAPVKYLILEDDEKVKAPDGTVIFEGPDLSEYQRYQETPFYYRKYPHWDIWDSEGKAYYTYPYDIDEMSKHKYALQLLSLAKYLTALKLADETKTFKNEAELDRTSKEDAMAILFQKWFTEGQAEKETLSRVMTTELKEAMDFLLNPKEHCSLCGISRGSYFQEVSLAYQQLYKEKKNPYQLTYLVNIKGKDYKIPVDKVLHLWSKHRSILTQLIDTLNLESFKAFRERKEENKRQDLSAVFKPTGKTDYYKREAEELSQLEEALLQYLKRRII